MYSVRQRKDDIFLDFEQISPRTTLILALEVTTIFTIAISKWKATQKN